MIQYSSWQQNVCSDRPSWNSCAGQVFLRGRGVCWYYFLVFAQKPYFTLGTAVTPIPDRFEQIGLIKHFCNGQQGGYFSFSCFKVKHYGTVHSVESTKLKVSDIWYVYLVLNLKIILRKVSRSYKILVKCKSGPKQSKTVQNREYWGIQVLMNQVKTMIKREPDLTELSNSSLNIGHVFKSPAISRNLSRLKIFVVRINQIFAISY